MTDFPTTRPVVAAALVSPGGQILMHRRRLGADQGGLWEFPGGKIEPSESAVLALARELKEELGIAVQPGDLVPIAAASAPGNPYVILLYTCRCWAGEPVCLDGDAIAWVPAAQLVDLPMPPLDVPLAQALIRVI